MKLPIVIHTEEDYDRAQQRAEELSAMPDTADKERELHALAEAMDKDLYDLPPRELKKIPTVCGSLREALQNLDKDRAFLKAGNVFTDDQIDSFIELKMTEVLRYEMTPHPIEFVNYYSL